MFISRTAHFLLVLKSFVILLFVGCKPIFAEDQFGKVKREAVSIFERKDIYAANLGLAGFAGFCHEFVQQCDTFVQGTQEGFFFGFDDRYDLCLLCHQFRISFAEVLDELRHQLEEESRTHIEESVTVAHGTAKDTTNDVTGFLIRRQLTVGDGECDGADMIGDDSHRNVDFLILAVLATADSADTLEHRLEDVCVVVRGFALDSTHETLKAHAGVDDFFRQGFQRTVCLAVELHEDNVPNLNHLRMIFVYQFASRHFGTLFGTTAVHVNLRTRTTRTGVAHFPEVIVLVAIQNMVSGQMFGPDRSRFIVTRQAFFGRTLENRGIQVSGIDLEYIYDIFPSEVNGLRLEIIAERPVAKHFKHGVMIGIVAYFLQVIVLSANAKALLAIRYAGIFDRIIAQDDTLPRVHTGVGEHESRVIFDDHWRRRDDLVSL